MRGGLWDRLSSMLSAAEGFLGTHLNYRSVALSVMFVSV